jgi:tetratricopeptide (TPR) repeat protein
MGNSLGKLTAPVSANFTHAVSGTRFQVGSAAGAVYQRIERNGLSAQYTAAYRIGSGNHATGYLVRIGSWLFQSPIAHYRRKDVWDVAPGYESMARPEFNRRVTSECLACHSSETEDALEPIGCGKCHGALEQHLKQPSRANIRNPARFGADARDGVCENCHLAGEARIGDTVFVYNRPRNDLRVVSHVEQLALSECAQRSERRLWCGTCHDPHGRKVDVSRRCRDCHRAALPDSHKAHSECTSCHMPKRDAVDGGHTAFTDHRIQRKPDTTKATSPAGLRLWREITDPALRERNLGLALVTVGERDGSEQFINEGYRRLASVFPKLEKDADVLASLGMVLFLKDQKSDAVKLLKAAVAQRSDAALLEKLAIVQRSAGDAQGAVQSLERAIALDPGRESAYFFLADFQTSAEGRKRVLERLLAVFPQSLIAREALARP